jgi:hypothetical protein
MSMPDVARCTWGGGQGSVFGSGLKFSVCCPASSQHIDPDFWYENFTEAEQNKILKAQRSNNTLVCVAHPVYERVSIASLVRFWCAQQVPFTHHSAMPPLCPSSVLQCSCLCVYMLCLFVLRRPLPPPPFAPA